MMSGLRRVEAFSLVELTLALGIGAFCLIAGFGLMPIAVQTNRNATSQTRATNIMAAVVTDLRATPKTNTTSAQFGITFGTDRCVGCSQPPLYFDSTGQLTSLGTNSRYQLNVTFPTNPDPAAFKATYAFVKVTWPPTVVQTGPTPVPSGSVEMFAAFDRN
jgi:uncharacterized protein (TIGR02598 family)